MAVPSELDALQERARGMRECLDKSQANTEHMVSILGSFDHRLSALEAAMRPTQVHTHAIMKAHENIDKTLKVAESILNQFEVARQVESRIMKGPQDDLEGYLAAVDQLCNNVEFFTSNKSFKNNDAILANVRNLLAKAMLKLEEEFKQRLSSYSKIIEPDRLFEGLPNSVRPSAGSPASQNDTNGKKASLNGFSDQAPRGPEGSSYTLPTLIPPRLIPLLHDLVQRMVEAGHEEQIVKIYRDSRASVLEQSLRKLGVEKLTKDDIQKMQWEILEGKIGNWIHYIRIAVKLLFAAERKLCDQVFEGLGSLGNQCFAEVTANSVAFLLSFGEAIAKSKRSPEKLFVLLDMYEIMRELLPEIDAMFAGNASSDLRSSALNLARRLAQTAQDTFGDFEEAVEKDSTKTSIMDGTVHPLTSYVINYVKFLFDYQATLKQLFQENGNGDSSNSQLATATMKIMAALQSNLDVKSKQYRDPALTQLFLMNNVHYMVRSVRRSEAKELLGEDWVQRHRRVVQQHANQYRRISWNKALQCLSTQGLTSSGSGGIEGPSSSGVSRAALKERFKAFNIQFEELHQRQAQWTVPDSELRESLRLAVAEILLPAYRQFVKRFGSLLDNGKNPQKYIKYTAEDLERMLGEFFEGKTRAEARR